MVLLGHTRHCFVRNIVNKFSQTGGGNRQRKRCLPRQRLINLLLQNPLVGLEHLVDLDTFSDLGAEFEHGG